MPDNDLTRISGLEVVLDADVPSSGMLLVWDMIPVMKIPESRTTQKSFFQEKQLSTKFCCRFLVTVAIRTFVKTAGHVLLSGKRSFRVNGGW